MVIPDLDLLVFELPAGVPDKSYIPKLVVDKSEVTITEQGFEGEQRIFVKIFN